MITCRELGEELIKYGDLPLKIRVEKDEEYVVITMLHEIDLTIKYASNTDYGDIDLVRMDIVDKSDV